MFAPGAVGAEGCGLERAWSDVTSSLTNQSGLGWLSTNQIIGMGLSSLFSNCLHFGHCLCKFSTESDNLCFLRPPAGFGRSRGNFRVYISIVYTLAIVCANFQRNLRTFVFWDPLLGLGVGCVTREFSSLYFNCLHLGHCLCQF